jgi:hypothetical protein
MSLLSSSLENGKFSFHMDLVRWERYDDLVGSPQMLIVPTQHDYEKWIVYKMALKIDDKALFESKRETILVLNDLSWFLRNLKSLIKGELRKIEFEPLEPDFHLIIEQCSEDGSDRSDGYINLFQVLVWIDYRSQIDGRHSGNGPALVFHTKQKDLIKFRQQLCIEKENLGKY